MARHSSLRASDADREAVTERLRQAAVEGRLEPEELEERLHAALRARTYGDLDRLLTDLPATPVVWKRPSTEVVHAAQTALAVATRVVVTLVVVTLVVVDAALTVAWWLLWALLRGHGYATDRLGAGHPPWTRRVPPSRPARLL